MVGVAEVSGFYLDGALGGSWKRKMDCLLGLGVWGGSMAGGVYEVFVVQFGG